MRKRGLIPAFLLMLLAVSAATAQTHLSFLAPAQYEGGLETDGAQWALLIFHNEDAMAHVDADGPALYVDHSVVKARVDVEDAFGYNHVEQAPSREQRMEAGLEAQVFLGGPWSSLYVEADRIHVAVDGAKGSLDVTTDQAPPGTYASRGWPAGTARFEAYPLAAGAIVVEGAVAGHLHLEAEGLRRVEWHNATVECPSGGECPGDAKSDSESVEGQYVSVHRYGQVRSPNGTLVLDGSAWSVVLGGDTVDVGVSGWARLPQVQWGPECNDACPALEEDRTLQAQGNLTLHGLTSTGGDRVATALDGDMHRLHLDETGIPPSALLGSAAAVGAAVGVVVLWKLLAWLAGRTAPEDPLANRNRRRLYKTIQDEPGLTIRGAAEAAGLRYHTARFHVGVLEKAGLITVKRHRNTLVLFENHGLHEAVWRRRAVLKNRDLNRLLDWLDENPGASQAHLVGEASGWGWPRSTALYRLRRLVEEGFAVTGRREDRPRYWAR